jgi:hypothetical protein
VVAGCGGDGREQSAPTLPAAVASELATRSDAVAAKLEADDPCGALADAESLQQEAIAAIDAGRVPRRYQEELTAAVDSLATSISCTITAPQAPDAAAEDEDDHEAEDEGDDDDEAEDEDDGKGKKGKGKGKGKKGKRG